MDTDVPSVTTATTGWELGGESGTVARTENSGPTALAMTGPDWLPQWSSIRADAKPVPLMTNSVPGGPLAGERRSSVAAAAGPAARRATASVTARTSPPAAALSHNADLRSSGGLDRAVGRGQELVVAGIHGSSGLFERCSILGALSHECVDGGVERSSLVPKGPARAGGSRGRRGRRDGCRRGGRDGGRRTSAGRRAGAGRAGGAPAGANDDLVRPRGRGRRGRGARVAGEVAGGPDRAVGRRRARWRRQP